MLKQKFPLLILVFFITVLFVQSQNKKKIFRDSIDNALDLSDFLINHKGVLPIVIPITEPAVGYGAALGAIHFIPKKDINHRPDMVVAFGGLTSNQTWLAGGGYIGYWKNDRIRYRGIAGYANVNLTYYAFGSLPIDFNMKSFLFLQQANFRISESDFFIGGKYQLSKISIPIFDNGNIPGVDPFDFELWNSGLSLITEYDNLNNFLSPTKGVRINLSYDQNLELLGSSRNWGRINFFTHMYLPVNEKWIPAFRVDTQLATGDVPFYAEPFVSLRGVPALRYQGELTMLVETEQLYNITSRWGILGFTGIGAAFDSIENMKSDEIVWNAGAGVRYLIARAYGLKMGFDVARGPEDWAFYVTVGTSWMK